MNRTKIECFDYGWSPNAGCSREGCQIPNCWANSLCRRFGLKSWNCSLCHSFTPHFHKERFEQPLHSRAKSGLVAVGFLGEFFDKQLLRQCTERQQIYRVMEKTTQFTYFILTKQPQKIPVGDDFPPNLWLGTTVNRRSDLWRIQILLNRCGDNPAFVFAEPLYEDLDDVDLKGVGWLVIGAQTHPNLQPKAQWVYALSKQASELEIPVFWKDNLTITNGQRQEFPKVLL